MALGGGIPCRQDNAVNLTRGDKVVCKGDTLFARLVRDENMKT